MKKIQNVEQVQDRQFDQRMRTFMECLVSPSLVVIAVRDGNRVVTCGCGCSDLFCSMTKLFTATALMQLRERGLVDLDRSGKKPLACGSLSAVSSASKMML
jgi:hypothetical protein